MNCFNTKNEDATNFKINSELSFLAVIPARAGSKRLPGKNIRDFNGKPLMQWTIEAALDSGVFSEIVVSTDSEKIADIATRAGASVPYLRSAELSSDTATTADVLLDVIGHFEKADRYFDAVVVLQVTSPLRQAMDITNAINIYINKDADSVISVCKCSHSPLWAGQICADGSLDGFIKPEHVVRGQALPQLYTLNGAIGVCNIESLKKARTFVYGPRTFPYVMEARRSVDIDDLLDFEIAEYIHAKLEK